MDANKYGWVAGSYLCGRRRPLGKELVAETIDGAPHPLEPHPNLGFGVQSSGTGVKGVGVGVWNLGVGI